MTPTPSEPEILGCFYDPDHEIEVYSFGQNGQGSYEETHGVRCKVCDYSRISINEWNTRPAVTALTQKVERYEKALEKIAAYGNDGPAGDENLAPWQELALNPQKAVEIAKDALEGKP